MTLQEVAAAAASVGLFVAYIPYFWGMYRGRTKPHAFSWVIWSLVTSIAAAAQLSEGGGLGAWLMAALATIRWSIALIALKKGEHTATRGDWISFILAVVAIAIWVMTKTPLYAVILISIIQIIAFYPTVRKSWTKPEHEAALMYILSVCTQLLMICALAVKSLITLLYPIVAISVNLLFVAMLLYRRRVIPKESS
jgi:hypothetical protein